MIDMSEEVLGQVMPKVFDVLIAADEEVPDEIFIDVHQCTYGPVLDARYKIREAKTGEHVFTATRKATPAEWAKARELDRWFMIEPENPGAQLATLPPELRRFAQVAVEWWHATQAE